MADKYRDSCSHWFPAYGKESHYTKCPVCNGKGYTRFYAVDIKTEQDHEISAATWMCLPPDRDDALRKRENYYRGYREECEMCDGTGEIEEDSAFDYEDFDDSDEMFARVKYSAI